VEQPQTYVTIAEACRELRISRQTLYSFLGTEIPVTRFGRAVRIHRTDLEAFEAAHRQEPRWDRVRGQLQSAGTGTSR
jgi:excisionase family DNA binding protein